MLADTDLYKSCDAENAKSLGCCTLDRGLWRCHCSGVNLDTAPLMVGELALLGCGCHGQSESLG